MKQRNMKSYFWRFRPPEGDKHFDNHVYDFKNKQKMMRFLLGNFPHCLNGGVTFELNSPFQCATLRMFDVWYNDNTPAKLKIELRAVDFRGSKYVFKDRKVEKADKKWGCFSNKIYNLMMHISNNKATPQNAKNLISLFKKRGIDLHSKLDENSENYVNSWLSKETEISFSYWSDRCNNARAIIIYEHFKRQGLL